MMALYNWFDDQQMSYCTDIANCEACNYLCEKMRVAVHCYQMWMLYWTIGIYINISWWFMHILVIISYDI